MVKNCGGSHKFLKFKLFLIYQFDILMSLYMSFYNFSPKIKQLSSVVFLLGSLLFLTACGGSASEPEVQLEPGPEAVVEPVTAERALEQIAIYPFTDSLAKGTQLSLTVTGFYSDNSNEDISNQVVWTVDNLAIATVDTSGNMDTVGAGVVTISAASNGFTVNKEITVTAVTLDSIEIIPGQAVIAAGTQKAYQAIGFFSDGTSQDITQQASWKSSNPQVAVVDAAQVSSVTIGNSTITASFNGTDTSSSLQVTAANLERIEINSFKAELSKGTSEKLTVTGYFSDFSTQDITDQVSWLVDDETVVELDSSNASMLALGIGSASLTASFSGLGSTVRVVVNDATLSHIEIQPVAPSIAAGFKQGFTATGVFSDQSTQDITQLVSWHSSQPSLADIDNRIDFKGSAEGFNTGAAVISANYQQMTASTVLTVDDATLVNIEVTPAHLNIVAGLQQQFAATAFYSDGSQQLVTDQVEWTSSDKPVSHLTGDIPGLFKANLPGATKIIASLNDMQSFTSMTITDALLVSLSITLETDQQPSGTEQQLVATGHYSNGEAIDVSQQVVWQVLDSETVSVNHQTDSVKLIAKNPGSTSLSVNFGEISVTKAIQVTTASLQQIELTSSSDFLYVNQQMQVQAIGVYSDGSRQDITPQVGWFSENQSIANINNSQSSKGLVHGQLEGQVDLYASFSGVTSEKLLFTIIDKPNYPASISIQSSPNVIFNNGSDATTLTVTVKPLQKQGVVADGTVINFMINEGGIERVETGSTLNGEASIELKSVFEGFIKITAEVSGFDISASTSVLSTTNFIYVLQITPVSQVEYSNGEYFQGSIFGLYIRNLSNRDFSLVAFQVKNGSDHFPESPVTDSGLLSDGLLSGGEYTGLFYQLDYNVVDNGITAGYILADQVLQQLFGFTASFSAL